VNLDSFHIIKVIGKGSFGKVFLVRHKARKTLHALKVLKKDFIIRKNQVEHTKTERSVLGYINHPYIVGLTMAFQTSDKLFFVLDYCAGGELFFHLGKLGRFPEDRAKFYAAQITLALEYVHNLGVIYRDLKPENVLLDDKGNIRLTDFGLSKEGVRGHSSGASSFCGTPEYIAPEVLKRQGHGRAVDWWSLGALLYEMISGLPPFYSRNRETMFDKIMKAEITFPQQMSMDAKDILSKLLVRDPQQRLGSGEGDAAELKAHPFFRDIDWATLATGTVIPPWAPMVNGSLDTSQFDEEFTSMMPTVSPDVRDAYFGTIDSQFEGFTFVDDSAAEHLRAHHESTSYMSSSLRSGAGATLMATSLKKR
jgi:serine/threonine protein kinase